MLALPSPDAPEPPAGEPDYRWSPPAQRAFLEALAETGSIAQAAAASNKSRRAAYNLRFRRDGAAFRIGWDAAVLVARAALADTLMERAIDGQEDVVTRDGDTLTRCRVDNRLGMSLLARLDRMACPEPRRGAETGIAEGTDGALARLVSQEFEAFLDLIERGGAGAEAALFVAARTPGGGALPAANGQCELGDHDEAAEPDQADDPGARVAKMRVWLNEADQWRTSYPPPPGFDGFEWTGFGADEYERSLTRAEQRAAEARTEAELAPLVEAGEAARDAWFGFTPDNSPDCREAAGRESDDEEEWEAWEMEEACEPPPNGHPGLEPWSSFLRGADEEREQEGGCRVEPGMTHVSDQSNNDAVSPGSACPELVEACPERPPQAGGRRGPSFPSPDAVEEDRASTGSAQTDSGGDEDHLSNPVRFEQSRETPTEPRTEPDPCLRPLPRPARRPRPYANGRPPDWLLQANGRW